MVALSTVRSSWACARVFRLKVHATFLYFIKDNIIVSTFCMLVKCENKLGVLLVARGQLSFAGVTCARVMWCLKRIDFVIVIVTIVIGTSVLATVMFSCFNDSMHVYVKYKCVAVELLFSLSFE